MQPVVSNQNGAKAVDTREEEPAVPPARAYEEEEEEETAPPFYIHVETQTETEGWLHWMWNGCILL